MTAKVLPALKKVVQKHFIVSELKSTSQQQWRRWERLPSGHCSTSGHESSRPLTSPALLRPFGAHSSHVSV